GVLAAMRRQAPVSVAAAGGVHGFPAPLTSFVGRAGPLREITDLLAGHRLVTVAGPGGAGKTRLAVQVARQVAGGLAGGTGRVLATSREPLRVAGEARYRLASLALPDLDDLAAAARAEAVALFAERARDADAHFRLDDRTAPAVARLVTRLDGMPLAIELAAA